MIFNDLLKKLHERRNPYTNFPVSLWRGYWYADPGAARDTFKTVITEAKPGLIIEVGSFVGESAIFMGRELKRRGQDAAILCVDTWLGGIDHWLKVPEKLRFHFGRSSLYYQFMANVIDAGMDDMILPLSLDSINAARLLTQFGIQAELIYVDASHEEGDVLRDYNAYWPLVKPGGTFMVDDLTGWFPGVVADWVRFLGDRKHDASEPRVEGEKGILVKK